MAETEAEKTPLLPGNGSPSLEGEEHHSKAEYGSSKRVRNHPVFSAFNGICQIITLFHYGIRKQWEIQYFPPSRRGGGRRAGGANYRGGCASLLFHIFFAKKLHVHDRISTERGTQRTSPHLDAPMKK